MESTGGNGHAQASLGLGALVAAALTFGVARATADNPLLETVVELSDTALNAEVSGVGNQDFFVDMSKVSPSFFTNHYAVLEGRISYDLAQVVDKDCPPSLTLYTSDTTKAAVTYLRRSSSGQVSVQRVAIAQPRERYYVLRVLRNGPVEGSPSQSCGDVQVPAVPFTLSIKLFASKAAATGFGFAQQHLPIRGDGEPSVAIDAKHGNAIFVSAPVGGPDVLGGTPGGVDFWRSFDGGQSWSYSQPVFGLNGTTGGFDSHVIVADNGDVWMADLGVAAIYVGHSSDRGATFDAVTPPPGLDSDREWLGTYTPPGAAAPSKVVVSYHDINADNLPYECLIVGMIGQPVCNPMATDPVVIANATGNTTIGNQVFDSTGNVYGLFTSPAAPSGGAPANLRNIYLAKSADGAVFSDRLVYSAPDGHDVAGLFPVIAIDGAGTLYAVWSERVAPSGSSAVKLAYSTDHGDHWSAPITVSPPGQGLLPWVQAGKAGQVDVVWVGSTSSSSNDPTADWYTYMGQSNGVLLGGRFTVARVTSQPVRYGNVCLSGIGCTTAFDDGRILLDFISNDIDSDCRAGVVFGNSGPEGRPEQDPSALYTDYAKQTSGTTVCK